MDLKPFRVAVLVSGGGTNLQALIDAQRASELDSAQICLVISSSESAYALERAKKYGIETLVCRGKDAEQNILSALVKHDIQLVVLAGYLKILSGNFLNELPIPIINIHPSLLPAYGGKDYYGLRVHEAVLANKEKRSGATVHYVTAETDAGEILLQKEVAVHPGDSPETLQRRIMEEAEWKLLPEAVRYFASKYKGRDNMKKRVLVLGGGGREHAILSAIANSPLVEDLFVSPGNPGMEEYATCLGISVMDFEALQAAMEEHHINFCVVSPDDPLVAGAVDYFENIGIPCFGPNKLAAQIEGSKVFSKAFMKENHIPSAEYEVFTDYQEAVDYVQQNNQFPIVLKADGLALGKGVIIADNLEEAKNGLYAMLEEKKFGDSGKSVVIEEFLTGPEVTLLCLSDGEVAYPLLSSMDHKQVYEGNKGPNTGGMGVIAPNPFYTQEVEELVVNDILNPTIEAMKQMGRPFKGCLYIGLMLTSEGPKVIEYNCRFGDPEAECILPMLSSDLLELMIACNEGSLADKKPQFTNEHAVTVMLCSAGYPGHYEKGKEITIGDDLYRLQEEKNIHVFHSGTKKLGETLYSNGGRVLAITAVEDSLEKARSLAYDAMEHIHFDKSFYRKDIGLQALEAQNNK